MRLNHACYHFAHLHSCFAVGLIGARKPICDSENGSEIVTWMAPFRGQPTIVVVQPANCGTDIEGTTDRIEFVIRSRNSCSVRDNCAFCQSCHAAGLPSTTGPSNFVHSLNLNASNPHPSVSIKHSLAVSRARGDCAFSGEWTKSEISCTTLSLSGRMFCPWCIEANRARGFARAELMAGRVFDTVRKPDLSPCQSIVMGENYNDHELDLREALKTGGTAPNSRFSVEINPSKSIPKPFPMSVRARSPWPDQSINKIRLISIPDVGASAYSTHNKSLVRPSCTSIYTRYLICLFLTCCKRPLYLREDLWAWSSEYLTASENSRVGITEVFMASSTVSSSMNDSSSSTSGLKTQL